MNNNYIVFGASPNKTRHSNKAVKSLLRHNRKVVPIGFRKGLIADIPILTGEPTIKDVDTLLMYVGSKRQPEFYEYLLELQPKKIVFNPGTENREFQKIASDRGIEVIEGCALVMINGGQL